MRCPRCDGPAVARHAGRVRFLARLVFLHPAKCDACRHRFWGFGFWTPPKKRGL